MGDRNVLGGELEPCGTDPLTGFYRDGCCTTGPEDRGSHTVCAVVTSEFLEHQRSIGVLRSVLASTHERALEIVPLAALKQHSVDVPEDASALDSDR
jgi:uncharacterized protein (DUF2237 family)